jgi:hypothetical protein
LIYPARRHQKPAMLAILDKGRTVNVVAQARNVAETSWPSGEACHTRAVPRTAETISRKLCSRRQDLGGGGSFVLGCRATKRAPAEARIMRKIAD